MVNADVVRVPGARLAALLLTAGCLCVAVGGVPGSAYAQRAHAAATETGQCTGFIGGQWGPSRPATPRNTWTLLWGLGSAARQQWESSATFCSFAVNYAKAITLNPNSYPRLPKDKITAGPKGGWTCHYISKNDGVCTRHPKGSAAREAFGFLPAPFGI